MLSESTTVQGHILHRARNQLR